MGKPEKEIFRHDGTIHLSSPDFFPLSDATFLDDEAAFGLTVLSKGCNVVLVVKFLGQYSLRKSMEINLPENF